MAEIREVRLVDDLDGSEATHTVEFSLDGRYYEIDLSDEHHGELAGALTPFILRARSVKPVKASPKGKRDLTRRTYLEAVRAWCKVNQIKVAERGRIPGPILEAYEAGKPELLKQEPTTVEAPASEETLAVPVPLFDDGGKKRSTRASKKASAN